MKNANAELAVPSACRESFINTMSLAAAGVTVVTSTDGDNYCGATVSAMSSVTADEPTLLVCVFSESRLAHQIKDSGIFAVNLLRTDQHDVSNLFAGRSGEEDRFSGQQWTQLHTLAPVLEDCLGAFDCQLVQQFEQGTHTIFIGRVVDTLANSGEALVYTNRNYHRLQPLVQEAS